MNNFETCNLCQKPIATHDTFRLGHWFFHLDCYRITLARLKPLTDILFAPQDEWDEYLNEILRVMFRRQSDAMLGIVKE